MDRVVVIASTPAGLRSAAWLARQGVEVRVLGVGGHVAGVPPEPGWEPGVVRVPEGVRRDLVDVWGPVAPVARGALGRALWTRGHLVPLPARRRALLRAVGLRALPGLGRRALTPSTSYRDALVARVGARICDVAFGPWARSRFATAPDDLSAAAALQVHRPLPGAAYVAVRPPERVHADRIDAVLDAGGEVLDDVEVLGFELDGDRVVAVETTSGREHVGDALLVDVDPARLASWLPSGAAEVGDALGTLRSAHAVRVTLRAATDLPYEVHVSDPDRPFWALTRPGLLPGGSAYAGRLTAHLTLDPADPLWAGSDDDLVDRVRDALRGLARVQGGDVVVRRLPHAVGVPLARGSVSAGRLGTLYERAGIVPVGGCASGRAGRLVDDLAALRARFAVAPDDARPGFPTTPLDFAVDG